jgi:2,5-diamino-6-(ribosylamino)-4(3H)-pyrimidinone 5'-phosphate reductase
MARLAAQRFTSGYDPGVTDAHHMVDRLWPRPEFGLTLEEAMSGFTLPPAPSERPLVAINMVTTIDGRAQLQGTAEGLGSRTDRQLLRHYRAAFDAVGSGVGTLRAAGLWLRVGEALAARRVADGRPPNPMGVLIAGGDPVATDAKWFAGDEPRMLVVGRDNPLGVAPHGTELLRAPDEHPEPSWVLERLAERGVRSFLLEGGPTVNAAFLAEGLIDELYWTVGPLLTAAEALPMIARIPGRSPFEADPRRGRLISVLHHDDELFLRYRFGGVVEPGR